MAEAPVPAARFLRWACDAAFPLWASRGFDPVAGRFEERLSLTGEPVAEAPLRLMTQARQLHVYAAAWRRGWFPDGLALVRQAFPAMVRDFYRRGGDEGWAFSVRRDGTPADLRRDLYGQAFALLAIAAYSSTTGDRAALRLADETLGFLDRRMAGEGGGFVEQLPTVAAPRRQNPHMHLFEALLALWECSGDAAHWAAARRLFDLFAARFYQPESGVLGEYYDRRLAVAEGLAGRIVEPGHHYEWIWLLRRFETLGGGGAEACVDGLYAHADRHGFDREGLIVDELLDEGRPHRRARRVWPMTEAIRANLAEAARGRAGAADKAAGLTQRLLDRFLAPAPRGGWIDRIDEQGGRVSSFMPASTLYHLVGALEAWQQAAPAVSPVASADDPDRARTGSGSGSATRCSASDRSTGA